MTACATYPRCACPLPSECGARRAPLVEIRTAETAAFDCDIRESQLRKVVQTLRDRPDTPSATLAFVLRPFAPCWRMHGTIHEVYLTDGRIALTGFGRTQHAAAVAALLRLEATYAHTAARYRDYARRWYDALIE